MSTVEFENYLNAARGIAPECQQRKTRTEANQRIANAIRHGLPLPITPQKRTAYIDPFVFVIGFLTTLCIIGVLGLASAIEGI